MRFELSMHEINMLEIVKVSKTFSQPDGNVKVLDQVNFDLPSAASAALRFIIWQNGELMY